MYVVFINLGNVTSIDLLSGLCYNVNSLANLSVKMTILGLFGVLKLLKNKQTVAENK